MHFLILEKEIKKTLCILRGLCMPSYMCINNCSKVCTNYISSLLKSWNWYPCRVKARKASRSDVICNCVLVLVHIFASFFFLCRSPSEHTFLGHNLNSYSHLVKTKISCAIVSTILPRDHVRRRQQLASTFGRLSYFIESWSHEGLGLLVFCQYDLSWVVC